MAMTFQIQHQGHYPWKEGLINWTSLKFKTGHGLHHFDETVDRYKQSWDVSTPNSGKKNLEMEHKALTSKSALLLSRLKTEGSDLWDKVSKMRKLGAQAKELVL